MRKIISQVTKTTTPSKLQTSSKDHIAETAFKLVEEEIKKFPEVLGIEYGGSYAKSTWLPKDADIDIFIFVLHSDREIRINNSFKKTRLQNFMKL